MGNQSDEAIERFWHTMLFIHETMKKGNMTRIGKNLYLSILFTIFGLVNAATVQSDAQKELFRATAAKTEALRIFSDKDMINFIHHRDLLIKASHSLCPGRDTNPVVQDEKKTPQKKIDSIRGQVQVHETRYGRLVNKQNVFFLISHDNFYLQWNLGENYKRRILYRAPQDREYMWYKDSAGIWQKIQFHKMQAGSLHLFRGGELLISSFAFRQCYFWFSRIVYDLTNLHNFVHTASGFMVYPMRSEKVGGVSAWRIQWQNRQAWPRKIPQGLKQNLFWGLSGTVWLRKKDYIPVKMVLYKNKKMYAVYEFQDMDINGPVLKNEFDLKRLRE